MKDKIIELRYDKEHDILDITEKGTNIFKKSIEFSDRFDIIVDYNSDDEPFSIEILDASLVLLISKEVLSKWADEP